MHDLTERDVLKLVGAAVPQPEIPAWGDRLLSVYDFCSEASPQRDADVVAVAATAIRHLTRVLNAWRGYAAGDLSPDTLLRQLKAVVDELGGAS